MQRTLVAILAIVGLLLLTAPLVAQGGPFEYRVTIYNLTKAQPFSPPVVVSHHDDIALFRAGTPASEQLALLAEDGDTSGLVELLGTLGDVEDVAVADGPVPPGGVAELTLRAPFPYHRLSAVGMLVNTNDAFFALDAATVPRQRFERETFYAPAYDAGSEFNNEDCDFIPGPACMSPGVRDTGDAEGYVYIHPGISGEVDLEASTYTWLNPVAKILVQRIR